MAKVSTNINLDPTLKKNAQELLRDLGILLLLLPFFFVRLFVSRESLLKSSEKFLMLKL
mgnify:CR=1 FL=1